MSAGSSQSTRPLPVTQMQSSVVCARPLLSVIAAWMLWRPGRLGVKLQV
jgi:hypothetical protein